VVFAVCADGSSPGEQFYEDLSPLEKAKLLKIFQYLGDHGECHNREKFKKVEGSGFFEFKSHQVRMLCWFDTAGRVIISHGFRKKGDKIPEGEIFRAERIKAEDVKREAASLPRSVSIIRRAGR
jgi:phage-related protein